MLQIRKLSPTNLGMLFNARQAAYEFGFLTLPEFAEATLGTLDTYDRLEKQRGHIYNWYDMETLQPIAPFTVSTVDSGNLAASLYTLHTGALDLLKRPLLDVRVFSELEQMSPNSSTSKADAKTDNNTDSAPRRSRRRRQNTRPCPLPPPTNSLARSHHPHRGRSLRHKPW